MKKSVAIKALLVFLLYLVSFTLANIIILGIGHIVPLYGYIPQILMEIIIVVIISLILRKAKIYEPFKQGMKNFFKGVFCVGAYATVMFSIVLLSNLFTSLSAGYSMQSVKNIVIFSLTMLSVGFCEEFVFRGIILNILIKKWGNTKKGVWRAALLSSLIFGSLHFINLISGGRIISIFVQVIVAMVLGLFFTAIYLRCNNIFVVIFLHAFIDFASLSSVGLFEVGSGSLIDQINTYSLINLLPVLTYGIPALVLLRSSKVSEITKRYQEPVSESSTIEN